MNLKFKNVYVYFVLFTTELKTYLHTKINLTNYTNYTYTKNYNNYKL